MGSKYVELVACKGGKEERHCSYYYQGFCKNQEYCYGKAKQLLRLEVKDDTLGVES